MNIPDSSKPLDLVKQFHETYKLPMYDGTPTLDTERLNMRMGLIAEEFSELVEAVYGEKAGEIVRDSYKEALGNDQNNRDIVETADALADLVYVIYGMTLECGIDLEAVLKEVQASNMSKLGEDGKPIYREDGKVLKGPNFFEPDIKKALGLK